MPSTRIGFQYSAACLMAVTATNHSSAAQAADASWGCQVLLCAASENPSWQSVSYCIPPMKKLIAAMAKPRFSWPICREAETGAPGYERYEDCPEGYTPTRSDNGQRQSSDPDMCTKRTSICDGTSIYRDRECIAVENTPRKEKANPFYYDVQQSNGVARRFWFNLNDG